MLFQRVQNILQILCSFKESRSPPGNPTCELIVMRHDGVASRKRFNQRWIRPTHAVAVNVSLGVESQSPHGLSIVNRSNKMHVGSRRIENLPMILAQLWRVVS